MGAGDERCLAKLNSGTYIRGRELDRSDVALNNVVLVAHGFWEATAISTLYANLDTWVIFAISGKAPEQRTFDFDPSQA